jgi:hypothetical protein
VSPSRVITRKGQIGRSRRSLEGEDGVFVEHLTRRPSGGRSSALADSDEAGSNGYRV